MTYVGIRGAPLAPEKPAAAILIDDRDELRGLGIVVAANADVGFAVRCENHRDVVVRVLRRPCRGVVERALRAGGVGV